MKIKYRVIEVHPHEHSMVVRFYTDLITEEMLIAQYNDDGAPLLREDGVIARCRTDYNITMYKDDMTEEEVDALIQQNAPAEWLKMQEKNLERTTDNMSMAVARALAKKDIEHEFTHTPPPVFDPLAPQKELTDDDIDALITKYVKTTAK